MTGVPGPDDAAALFAQAAGAPQRAWDPPSVEALAGLPAGLEPVRLAGRGGMGAVYEARQERLGRTVAVKLLAPQAAPDAVARERFLREARLLAALRHPGILGILDLGELPGGLLYMILEWAGGGDLGSVVARAPLRPAEVAAWLGRIAPALAAAHAAGVVHRDIKPSNILLPGDGRALLADFGIARAPQGREAELTFTDVALGTVGYMAPEQAAGRAVTPAADVYALGVLTYQLLTGRLPQGAFAPVSATPGVPRAVDAVLRRALDPDPLRRPADAGAFWAALEPALQGRARRRFPAWFLATIGVATAAVAAWWVLPAARVGERAREVGRAGTVSLLAAADPMRDALAGVWRRDGGGIVSGTGTCFLALGPVPASYTVRVVFTRLEGEHSVVVVLPTAAGTGTFELDAWDEHLGGLQEVDGVDLRRSPQAFPARLRNGERQEVVLRVDPGRVEAQWNGRAVGVWSLEGRRLSVPGLFGFGPNASLAIGSWDAPTAFHEVELLARGE